MCGVFLVARLVKNPPANRRDTGDAGLIPKESAYNAGDRGSIPGSGRSPGEGNRNPLQDSCLGNPMDRGAWWATVHGVTKSQTWLNMHTQQQFSTYFKILGKSNLLSKKSFHVWEWETPLCFCVVGPLLVSWFGAFGSQSRGVASELGEE